MPSAFLRASALALVVMFASALTPHRGLVKTFRAFADVSSRRFDCICATPDVKALSPATTDDKPYGEYASDHYPVAASLRL